MLAQDIVSQRFVAIKQLHEDDKDKQKGMIDEIEVVSKFSHPNVIHYNHHFFHPARHPIKNKSLK